MNDALQHIIAEMGQAWNAGDAQRFASVFANNGAQVNIFGKQLRGRGAIADQHDRVFKTVFRGSENMLEIIDAQELSENVLLARVSSLVIIPEGPMRGELRTIGSLVLRRRDNARWEIVLFHNTRISAGPPHPTPGSASGSE